MRIRRSPIYKKKRVFHDDMILASLVKVEINKDSASTIALHAVLACTRCCQACRTVLETCHAMFACQVVVCQHPSIVKGFCLCRFGCKLLAININIYSTHLLYSSTGLPDFVCTVYVSEFFFNYEGCALCICFTVPFCICFTVEQGMLIMGRGTKLLWKA